MSEHEADDRESGEDEPTTSPETGPEEASSPPGGGDVDEEAVERGEDELDQAGGGH